MVLEKLEKVLTADDVRSMYPTHVDKVCTHNAYRCDAHAYALTRHEGTRRAQDYWADLENFMTSGPSVALVISRPEGTGENVISDLHKQLGPPNVDEARASAPESLRAQFGSERFVNGVHAADSKDAASR